MIFFYSSFNLFLFSLMNMITSIIFLIKKLNFLFNWIIYMNNSLMIKFICFFDWMSLMFISTIFFITSMVILYSIEYMNSDLNIKRFMMLILIFMMSMMLVIFSLNLMTILLGWDGLGLSSYCLVIYYQNKKSYNSGMITILMNRIGDIFILISISILMQLNSWNFLFYNKFINLLMILIFISAITKSAQIPFSTWLPLAMAAPTPISSLVHSSTLVTAGVYLLIRFNMLISKNFLILMLMTSSFTMFFSGITANFEFDLKKIIALSTLSQLGLMIFILSFNLPMLTFFHLINHAMFKSLLFLCSGIMIHNFSNNQDIRFISMNNFYTPLINMIFLISSLTLCGMPFLTGFFSKDLIIEMFNMKFNNIFMFMIMYLSMGLTISYSTRLMMFLNFKFNKISIFLNINIKNLMNYSIIMLIFMSMFIGSILNWLIFNSLNFIYLPKTLKLMIFHFLTLGIMIGLFLMKLNFLKNIFMLNIFKFFNLMFFLPMNFKKTKINFYKMNFILNFIQDYGWNEYILTKKFLYMMNLDFNKFMKLNLLMMLFSLYMILFYMIFF
uniref:NADH dehydrogenase subunit 5 n=1 Tax=Microplitis manilae TaxID=1427173 RepID=UPI002551F198|nr:NADH dehydrogenase subunit 5 [Microplitis manilae]WGS91491.1 NADH dehydrogenase subunit 5 [Microplitis manilae]WUY11106.1 NADH dehydrogenase subunit 5 [Microplitis manilae]